MGLDRSQQPLNHMAGTNLILMRSRKTQRYSCHLLDPRLIDDRQPIPSAERRGELDRPLTDATPR
jgi:hypothetical protein